MRPLRTARYRLSTSAARSAIFVGREPEIRALEAQATSALSGRGTFALVSGAAGIGKTRLLETATAAARERGFTAFASTNYANVRAPFGPFADLLRDVRAAIPKAVPEVTADATLFGRLIGIATDSLPPSNWDKRRLFVIVADVLARAAIRVPLFLTIDDMQWADPESVELAGYLATRVDRSRISILLAQRERDASNAAVDDDLADAARRIPQALSIELTPLEETALRTIVASLPVSGLVDGRIIDEICRRSDGNPYILEELSIAAKADNGKHALPKVLQQATLKRVASLDDRSLSVLETASALGRIFRLEQLVETTGLPTGDVVLALRRARDLDVVVEHEADFRFRHELVRIVIYDSMLAAQRSIIHGQIARALPSDAAFGTLAYHWRGAGDSRKAAEFAERAGDLACELNAHASARDSYWLALESSTLDDAERARVDEKIAAAYDRLGDSNAAAKHYQSAFSYAVRVESNSAVVDLQLAYATVVYRAGEVDAAIDACRIAASSPNATLPQKLSAHVSLATFYAYRADVASARDHIGTADALDPQHVPLDRLRLEWARATVASYANDGSWLDAASLSVKIAENFAKPSTLAMTLMSYAAMTRECGRADLSPGALVRAIELADTNGLSLVSAYGRCELLDAVATRGDLEVAYQTILEISMLGVKADVVRILVAGLGLPVLIDLDRSDQFPQFLDPELLETAFESGEPFRLAPLASAHAYAAWMHGKTAECQAMIERVLPKLSSPKYIGIPLLLLARGADVGQLIRIRDIFHGGNATGLTGAFLQLVETMIHREQGNAREKTLSGERALSSLNKNDAPLMTALALELLGRREEAVAIYRDYGATAHVRRLQTKRAGNFSLRETEVALLLRSGISNRSIAERLSISERTVENHVAAIYAKSGVRSRSEFLTGKI